MSVKVERNVPLLSTEDRKKFNTFYVESLKIGASFWLKSELEFLYWLKIEFDPNVIDFLPQHPVIIDQFRPVQRIYTFDMWVKYRNGIEHCIDIKPTDHLVKLENGENGPENWRNWLSFFDLHSLQYKLVTEVTLSPDMTFLMNAEQILPYLLDLDIAKIAAVSEKIMQLYTYDRNLSIAAIGKNLPTLDKELLQAVTFWLFYNEELCSDDVHKFGLSQGTEFFKNESLNIDA